jgi:hypothetical protein
MYNKYNAKKTEVDGIIFASKAEANRYCELKLLHKVGKIHDLNWQVPYELVPKQKGERAVKYIADFVYFEDGKMIVEDCKGIKTPQYIIKRKLFKQLYPQYVFRESK